MSPLPPSTVSIKRKATDDPVEVLHVHDEIGTVRAIDQYVFKRQRFDVPLYDVANFTGYRNLQEAPKIIATGPGDEHRSSPLGHHVESATLNSSSAESVPRPYAEPRRFRLSRTRHQIPTGGVRNRKGGAKPFGTLFVESSKDSRAAQAVVTEVVPYAQNEPDAHKLEASLSNVTKASPEVPAYDKEVGGICGDMQAYAEQERVLADATIIKPFEATTSTFLRKPSSKYSPKPPALRYHERNGASHTITEKRDAENDHAMKDAVDIEGDDSEYIIDTYIRVPADLYRPEGPSTAIGLLVLDSQPDLDEFYNDDLDSDSEAYDDEEDENAEDHPGNDYPEEQSDDEYGRNPYLDGNDYASDNGDSDDGAKYSDDENESTRYPWSKRPWTLSHTHRTGANVEDDEEDF